MKHKRILAMILISALALSGCSSNKEEHFEPEPKNATIEICNFEDFQYLMFTVDGESVIRDADGNEYKVGTDGYYYDADGNRINVYGAGDEATVKLGKSTGAYLKSEKGNVPDDIDNMESTTQSTTAVEKETSSGEEVVKEVGDGSDGNIYIEDWNSYKEEIMSNAGINEDGGASWHNHEDGLEPYRADNGDSKIMPESTYETNLIIGDSIPATVDIKGIQNTGSGGVSGTITLDGEAYLELAKDVIGETRINENGEEVPADYTELIVGKTCDVYMLASDGFHNVLSDTSTIVFNEEYTGDFSVSCEIPEGYTPYLVINGIRYNI